MRDEGRQRSLEKQLGANDGNRPLVLLATDRRWLRSALEDVLSPEGFQVGLAEDASELQSKAEGQPLALVLVDEELPGFDVEETARTLVSGPLGPETPLLLYSSSAAARVKTHTQALNAGFWELLTDPLRPEEVIARLRRMLAISARMKNDGVKPSSSDNGNESPAAFLSLEELGRVLPAVAALAERQGTTVSIVLLEPTGKRTGDRERRREVAASVCGPNLRRADLCAWVNDSEVAVVAFGTSAAGAQRLVERLDALAAGRTDLEEADRRLSAAIVELEPSTELERTLRKAGRPRPGEPASLDEVVEMFHLQDARKALSEARAAGGGIRVIYVA